MAPAVAEKKPAAVRDGFEAPQASLAGLGSNIGELISKAAESVMAAVGAGGASSGAAPAGGAAGSGGILGAAAAAAAAAGAAAGAAVAGAAAGAGAVANTTPPPLPAGSYDVGAMKQPDIDKLAKSKDPAERDLAATITRAKSAYADRIASGARIVVNSGAANGNKPVLTMIPKGFDYNKPATVQTHYHGWNSTVADAKGHGAGLAFRMNEVQDADPQHVYVLPECKNGKAGAYHTDWSNVSSTAKTADDAAAAAGITNVGTRVVSAHSGGGAAIANAIDKNPDGSGLKADKLVLLDCLYGSQAQVEKWASTANGKACGDVTYYHGTNDAGADGPSGKRKGLPAAFGSNYHRINVSTPKPMPTGVGPNGKPVPRFNADPHNSTVGLHG